MEKVALPLTARKDADFLHLNQFASVRQVATAAKTPRSTVFGYLKGSGSAVKHLTRFSITLAQGRNLRVIFVRKRFQEIMIGTSPLELSFCYPPILAAGLHCDAIQQCLFYMDKHG
jgi:hypothetical protein